MYLVPYTRQSQVVRSFFNDGFFDSTVSARSPALDVAESDTAYTVTLDLPGVAKADVNVAIDGRRVTVSTKTAQAEDKKDGDRIVWRERATGSSYSRTLKLPVDIDQAASGARLDNGVLTLTLTKRAAATAAQIAVN